MRKLKYFFLLIAFSFLCQGCGTDTKTKTVSDNRPTKLSNREVFLCDSINYDKAFADVIKEQTGTQLQLIAKIDSATGEVIRKSGNGLCVLLKNKNEGCEFVLRNKFEFLQKGYLLF